MSTERELFDGAEPDAQDSGRRTMRAVIIAALVAVVGIVGVVLVINKGTDDPDAGRCDFPVIFYTGPKEDIAQEDIDSGCYRWMEDPSPEELAEWKEKVG